MTTRVLIPSGVLGLGFDQAALARGVAKRPDIICIDGGSTDSGPFYLGTGTSKYSRAATKAEWRRLMQARAEAGVPLVIGSCGTCGTDACVDWMLAITRELAVELNQSVSVATVYSSQSVNEIQHAITNDRIFPLEPVQALAAENVTACTNIVALAGVEPIIAAIQTGANIILAGRATDTATVAALAILRGEHPGASWHAAKVAECGALCSTHPTSGVVMVEIDNDGFNVEALADGAACTPHTVSAHMLYENADPYRLLEPGGCLDVTQATYAAIDAGRVRVGGSTWIPAERYTVKLEGARIAGYQTTTLAILRDPRYVANANEWVHKLNQFLIHEISERMGLSEPDYALEFRIIGMNAALGELEQKTNLPTEVGVLGIITAQSADTAREIGKLINPFLLHYPLTAGEELPTFAFPYSPAESDRGALYEFCINHVLALDDPMSAFRIEKVDLNHG